MLKPRPLLEPVSPQVRKSNSLRLLVVVSVIIFTTLIFILVRPRHPRTVTSPAQSQALPLTTKSFAVQPGEILPFVFNRAGVPTQISDQVIGALGGFGFNFRRIRPGDSLIIVYRCDSIVQIRYWRNYDSIYQIDLDSSPFTVTLTSLPISTVPTVIKGAITGSLYQSLLNLGEKPVLVAAYTEIFDWEIDFFSETQPGDSFIILVTRKYLDSVLVGYGKIIAARYKGVIGEFNAFLFTDPEGNTDYYNPDGLSMRKLFLKSPLRFSRISSFFGNRFHPIRHIRCAHHGIDYAAPTGTPVSCVADGRVISAGWYGGYGRLVRIGHRDGYETRYGHLSSFGKGIKTGAPVTQGQIIGYVGSTGLSTGPHLHYEVRKFGTPVNPLRLNPPRAGALKLAYLPAFRSYRDSLLSILNQPLPQQPIP
jgi:murein DD-endopeptidase MepM/ murein hydrolase activator NlpD